MSQIPGLANLPILGNLFKTKNVSRNNTELVVLVTPEITLPLQPGESKGVSMPRDFMVTPASPANPFATPKTTKKSN
jgi:pilus assembly protein CpaC